MAGYVPEVRSSAPRPIPPPPLRDEPGRADGTAPELSAASTERIRAAIVASGHVWTRQRAAVVTVLRQTRVPLDADELHRLTALRVPRISRTTVYHTIVLLRAYGFLRERGPGAGGRRRGRGRWPDRVRLVCRACGNAVVVHSLHLAPLLHDVSQRHRFDLTGGGLVLTGRCASCATK
jgi:Fe2+ or Zn2+ uptake regulation protein